MSGEFEEGGFNPEEDLEIGEEKEKTEEELEAEAKAEREQALKEIKEMEDWRELKRRGELTEEAEEIFDKLFKEIIPEIDSKRKILADVREEAERFKGRIEKGEFDDRSGIRRIPEERWRNPLIDLKERDKEFEQLENGYRQLKEKLRELEKNGSLIKKVEKEEKEEEKKIPAERETPPEEPKRKFLRGLGRKKQK